jgi:hypothetical protein
MAASDAPHSPQNLCPVGFLTPQSGHVVTFEEPNRDGVRATTGSWAPGISRCDKLPRPARVVRQDVDIL